ncbi:MAG: NAD-dependent epimerase/dehydratase family protein [Myxococcales bacterium]|nr:NAD-dependent epimerase/dehydratase family protein [Myxococcales bacterium]
MTTASSSTVFVTGATGYIGGRLVPRLLERGYGVRCLARSAAKLRARPWPASGQHGDGCADVSERVVQGHRERVNAGGCRSPTRINVVPAGRLARSVASSTRKGFFCRPAGAWDPTAGTGFPASASKLASAARASFMDPPASGIRWSAFAPVTERCGSTTYKRLIRLGRSGRDSW